MSVQSVPSMAPSSPEPIQRSPWHSPVPYLFGGLAAMLGLIAFALLILACSYWKLSGDMDNGGEQERDIEAGDSKPDNHEKNLPPVFEEKYLVIMAGQVKPTFIATAVSSRVSSFGSCSSGDNSKDDRSKTLDEETMEKEKQVTSIINREVMDQVP
ncbi:putative protein glutamine dumper [Helianthus annuus]|uniref:Glutamine dumper 3 n=1 Tax=Helianthus annuus TaxID=4232 RepID=A0A251UNK5_HELAN|nr:protein GLUTAMINE DUMPER 2 [Helianthus annuus]KAF5804722.1 putative protein glutamine dumper [Helianthus annuus]KAJ0569292.1 putative protein glutamine dumper [Helianthus annuus]KAJ0575735.1 putative protein glutamine dumper [Helianthus annuus]KAJ0583600.1 putative protein glutamine dumper [Helianthus annuus]KAJ0917793.1 putative protein glutamine dumper [Helianthus annuus]